MICPYFLPRRRVGALRPFKFAIHLKEEGWEPYILTIKAEGTLTHRERELLKGINVYELIPPMDRTKHSQSQQSNADTSSDTGPSVLEAMVDKNFPVDTWLPFFWIKWNQIRRYMQSIAPDAVWSTGDPWSAHWIGKKIKSIYPEIPWIADFRDPWTVSDTNLKKRTSFVSVLDRWIERRWIKKASLLTFTSHQTRKNYEQAYPDLNLETETIYNAFEPLLFDTNQQGRIPQFDSNKFNLLFFGRFRKLSNAKSTIRILEALKNKYPSIADQVAMHVFGPLTVEDRDYATSKGVEACFRIHNPVSVERGLQILNNADLLWLSTNPQRTDIIPAKLWDYLASDRPILSIAPNGEINQILEQTGAGQQFPSDAHNTVADLIKECVEAKNRGKDLPISNDRAPEIIEKFNARSTTEKLVQKLEQLLD